MTFLQTQNDYILGLDPGLRRTGWGVISVNQQKNVKFVAAGIIAAPLKISLAERLAFLAKHLSEVMKDFTPTIAVVEKVFVNKNPTSTLLLGMARGVVMAAPALYSIPVMEYSANTIKKTVTNSGHASKEQVAGVLRLLLSNVPEDLGEDATDALAVSVCHAFTMRV